MYQVRNVHVVEALINSPYYIMFVYITSHLNFTFHCGMVHTCDIHVTWIHLAEYLNIVQVTVYSDISIF